MQSETTHSVSVNGVVIPEGDIGIEMQYHPAPSAEESWYQAAQSLVIKKLLIEKATSLALAPTPMSEESEEEALIRALVEEEVNLPTCTDQDCENYFNANAEHFKSPTIVEAEHILLAADPQDMDQRLDMETRAKNLIELIVQNPDRFIALVKEYSDCPSKEVGGNLGQLTKGSTVKEFEDIVFSKEPGLIPYPVESRFGYHIVRVVNRVEGDPLPYEAVQQKIKAYLTEQVYRKAVRQYIQILIGEAEIQGIDLEGSESPLLQ